MQKTVTSLLFICTAIIKFENKKAICPDFWKTKATSFRKILDRISNLQMVKSLIVTKKYTEDVFLLLKLAFFFCEEKKTPESQFCHSMGAAFMSLCSMIFSYKKIV